MLRFLFDIIENCLEILYKFFVKNYTYKVQI